MGGDTRAYADFSVSPVARGECVVKRVNDSNFACFGVILRDVRELSKQHRGHENMWHDDSFVDE